MSTLGGTASKLSSGADSQELSFGNVLPEVQVPWGFNGWAPTTALNSGSWWFDGRASNLFGVRCTRQPSPWIGDYGDVRVMAHVVDPGHEDANMYAAYSPRASACRAPIARAAHPRGSPDGRVHRVPIQAG
jgi:putative alpha-1,2-mannosidase